ncbi:ORF C-84 [Sulfolobus spindle-shaped virus 1]|uniref:Uncharacterized protein C-84 n=1 Tax=Sulfolobus spindle-shape virus 1 TaxID=244589 RepID=C84_SSV1|nr:ORF C-84 [Sulfolobus spindle-shaped virus 1]P20212.1 RecName: Full=Uncharacterized protein C-84 [Sulfolobus spindle-shaped virus 1]CAA30206.1 ORF C-84 [Sulfolobus spindle-shaped virus 1]
MRWGRRDDRDTGKILRNRSRNRFNIYHYVSTVKKVKETERELLRLTQTWKAIRLISYNSVGISINRLTSRLIHKLHELLNGLIS